MNAHELDLQISDWIQDGPVLAPERSIAAALDHARAHPRRRDPLGVLRRDPMASPGGFGLRALPIVVALGLLLVAALAVASAGGWFDQRPVIVPPVQTPSPRSRRPRRPSTLGRRPRRRQRPSRRSSSAWTWSGSVAAISRPSRSWMSPAPWSMHARASPPRTRPTRTPTVTNDPADPATVVLTWYGLLSDTDRRLTIAPDGRTMTLDKLPGCGDLVPVNRVLALTFNGPVPADEVTVTIVDEPRTCE